jgi:hypothetical protein
MAFERPRTGARCTTVVLGTQLKLSSAGNLGASLTQDRCPSEATNSIFRSILRSGRHIAFRSRRHREAQSELVTRLQQKDECLRIRLATSAAAHLLEAQAEAFQRPVHRCKLRGPSAVFVRGFDEAVFRTPDQRTAVNMSSAQSLLQPSLRVAARPPWMPVAESWSGLNRALWFPSNTFYPDG